MIDDDDEVEGFEPEAESRVVTVAILSIASRVLADDPVSAFLGSRCQRLGHQVLKRLSLPPSREAIEAQLRAWIAEDSIDVILVSGGVGVLPGDVTPEAIRAVVEREMPGYGEAVRAARSEHVGLRAIHGRETAGVAGGTFVLATAAELEACSQVWDAVLEPMLDPSSDASIVPLLARLVPA
jgi:molybdenum cofactor biosynthesis protein B